MGGDEAVLSDNNEDGGVDEGHQEHVSHDTDVIGSYVLVSENLISNEVEDVSDDDVDKSNPHSKHLGLVLLNISDRGPVFAVLLAVGKQYGVG